MSAKKEREGQSLSSESESVSRARIEDHDSTTGCPGLITRSGEAVIPITVEVTDGVADDVA
jgi:hypothetical protein